MINYSISASQDGEICEIFLAGSLETEHAIDMLNEVWVDEAYQQARYVLWNVERCEAFPDFNQFLRIVNHARLHKPEDGPALIAFYSSAFTNSMLARVLQGFISALPYHMAIFGKRDSALAWFESNESDAA